MNYISISSLVFVIMVSSGFIEMLNDIFQLRAPAISYVSFEFAVFWVPVTQFILWFNAICKGGGKFKIVIPNTVIAGAVSILIIFLLESYHALINDNVPEFELVFCWTWVLYLFFTISSFNYGKVNWLEVTIVIIALCSSFICLLSLIFPIYSLRDLGINNYFSVPLRPLWSGVNSNSYFSALILGISFYKVLYRKLTTNGLIFWIGISGVNLIGIIFNKARGAWFAALTMMIMMVVIRIAVSKARKVVWGGYILGIICVFIVLIWPHINWEAFLSFGRGLTSVRTRILMFSTASDLFMQSPLIGIGWAQVLEHRVAGHAIHGVVQTIAASYGLVGIALFGSILYFSFPRRFDFQNSMMILSIIGVAGTASVALMTPPFWFAIVLSLLYFINEGGGKS